MKKLNTFKPSDSIVLERDMQATIKAVDVLPISKEDQDNFPDGIQLGDKLFLKDTQQVVLWFGFDGTTMVHQLISNEDYKNWMKPPKVNPPTEDDQSPEDSQPPEDDLSPTDIKPILSSATVDDRENLFNNHFRSFYYLRKVPSDEDYNINKAYYRFMNVASTNEPYNPYEYYYAKTTDSNGNLVSMLVLTGDKTQWEELEDQWENLESQWEYFKGQGNLWQIFVDKKASTDFETKKGAAEGLWTLEPVRIFQEDEPGFDGSLQFYQYYENLQYYVYKDFGNAFVSLEPGKLYEFYDMTKMFTVIDIYQDQKYPGTNKWEEIGTVYGSTEMEISLRFWRTYDSIPKGKLGPCVLIGSTVKVYANRITNRDGSNNYTGKEVVVSMQWKDPEDIIDPKNPENNAIWAYTVVVRKRITGYQSHQSPTVFGMQDALMGNMLLADGSGVRGDFVAPYDQIASSSDATEIMRSSVRNQFSTNGLVFKDVVPLDGEYMYELFAVTETGVETGTHENALYKTSMEELNEILLNGNPRDLLHLGDVISIPHSILGSIEFEIVDIDAIRPNTSQHTLTLMSRNAFPYGVYDAPEFDSYAGGSGNVKHPGASSDPSTTTSGCSNWHNSNLRQWLNSSSSLEETTDTYWYEGKRYWRLVEGVFKEVETPVDPHTVNPSLNGWYTYTDTMSSRSPYDRLPGDGNNAALYRDRHGNVIPGFLTGFDETVRNMLLTCNLTTENDPALNSQASKFPTSTEDKVWIPSIDQLFGTSSFAWFREGTNSLGSVIRSSEATGRLVPYYTRTQAGAAQLTTVKPKDEVTKAPIGTSQGEITNTYDASYTESDRETKDVPCVVICMVLTGHSDNSTN